MKLISYNVNGIRAAISKGFMEWLETEMPDVIHIQETKAMQEQVDVDMLRMFGYEIHWFAAERKGYSGVATFTKLKPKNVVKGIGNDFFDSEGRFLRLDFEDFTLINSYFPSGTSGDVRQEKKEEYLELVLNYTNELRKTHPNIIVSCDYNICHKPIDINHPEKHEYVSGFLPNGWTDLWRVVLLTVSGSSTHSPNNIRGGATVAAASRKILAGALTTIWSAPIWQKK